MVKWIKPNGETVAQASFSTARLTTFVNAAAIFQPRARVVGGTIYYVDARGTIRSLSPTGNVSEVAQLLLRPGQNIVSFAVSPDGRRAVASILTYPPQHDPPPQSGSDPFLAPGHWWYDYESAEPGQTAQRVVSRDLGEFSNWAIPTGITTVFGWDAGGPIAILNTTLAAQQVLPNLRTPGSALVHLGPDGSHLDQLGGPDCHPLGAEEGLVLCWPQVVTPPIALRINTTSGKTLWSTTVNSWVSNPRISPSGSRICADGGVVYFRDAPEFHMELPNPSGYVMCQGWIGESMLALQNNQAIFLFDVAARSRYDLLSARGAIFLGTA